MGVTALVVQVVFGVLIIAFALSRVLCLSNLLLFAGGAALVVVFSLMISLVQLIAPNEMRGRVMSIYMVAFRGGMPLGSLASGWMANATSAPTALVDQRRPDDRRGRLVPRLLQAAAGSLTDSRRSST